MACFFDYHDFNRNFCHTASTSKIHKAKKLKYYNEVNDFYIFKILLMTLILIVWFRKYDQNQDFDSDDENLIKKNLKVFLKKVTFALFKFF